MDSTRNGDVFGGPFHQMDFNLIYIYIYIHPRWTCAYFWSFNPLTCSTASQPISVCHRKKNGWYHRTTRQAVKLRPEKKGSVSRIYPPWKLTWQAGKSPCFDRRYIFIHGCVSSVMFVFGGCSFEKHFGRLDRGDRPTLCCLGHKLIHGSDWSHGERWKATPPKMKGTSLCCLCVFFFVVGGGGGLVGWS